MRSIFCNIIDKKIYSLPFDRSSECSNSVEALEKLLEKLKCARSERAIVVVSPESVKSLFLKFIDLLQTVEAAPPICFCPLDLAPMQPHVERVQKLAGELRNCARKADILQDIMELWGARQRGIALLDEVDLLLHPLKSELNFPIGPKVSPREHSPPCAM